LRVHYDPADLRVTDEGAECLSGALGETTGGHFHRHCRCGAEWIEVSLAADRAVE
jgi:hypothetical protein